MKLVIVTGMSGAGKTIALKMLEDMGFYCVDNLPISLVDKFAQLAAAGSDISQAALGIDIRSGEELSQLDAIFRGWKELGMDYQILFLDANDGVLIKRYKETRRSHPLAVGGVSLSQAVEREKALLTPVRQRADYIIDSTTFHTNAKLRSVLLQLFGDRDRRQQLQVNVQSFGYKYGLPLEADLVLDVRFLPNPFYKAELRQHNGLEEPVRDYLFQYEETAAFLSKLEDLLRFLLPLYEEEGKSSLVIAVGCTGGQHRSVAISHAIVQQIRAIGYPVTESHRDMTRERK